MQFPQPRKSLQELFNEMKAFANSLPSERYDRTTKMMSRIPSSPFSCCTLCLLLIVLSFYASAAGEEPASTCAASQDTSTTTTCANNQSSALQTEPPQDLSGGFLIFALAMGRYGNQMEHLLGALAEAKRREPRRIIVLPSFIVWRYGRGRRCSI